LGEYGNASQSVILLEHNGQLLALANRQHLTPYNPATNPVSPAGLLWHGQTLPRLPDPNRDFRIQLEQPVSALRPIADAAQPPAQPPHLLPPDLVNLRTLSPSLHFDIRYATSNNFMGAALYSQPAAYLQRPAAQALLRAHQQLASSRVGLLIHDAYRPWRVTRMFWDATPHHQRNFVANPAGGSRHNRGCAVDLSLYDLQSGQPLTMPSGFDEFSPRAYPDYPGGSSLERFHRRLLRRAMEQQGFTVNDDEWWHFDYQDWQRYPILNLSFEQLGSR
ncbi:MAG: M15 family metallopeptidase, partial [Acidobacteriota bacterium]